MESTTLYKVGIILFATITTLLLGKNVDRPGTRAKSIPRCTNPAERREWRTLRRQEQTEYLDAVLCMAETPSPSRSEGTLYDDFAFVHMQVGAYCTTSVYQ